MEENSCVFDSFIAFLRSPIWNVPVLTFIEKKSIIFDPECSDDENHRKIHQEYNILVDFILGSYMEDIGISSEQFEEDCQKHSEKIKDGLYQTLFEQILAADDYAIFRRMMIQKNLEIHLQALEFLQHQYGIISDSSITAEDLPKDEQTIMEEVMKIFLEDQVAYQQFMNQEQLDLERALAESQDEANRLDKERNRERGLMMDAITHPPEERAARTAPLPSDEIDPEELAKKQYLRRQRDKLLEMKRKEREKQLSAYEENTPQSRPKSSRAARKAMKGSTIYPQTVQLGKALADRLRRGIMMKLESIGK